MADGSEDLERVALQLPPPPLERLVTELAPLAHEGLDVARVRQRHQDSAVFYHLTKLSCVVYDSFRGADLFERLCRAVDKAIEDIPDEFLRGGIRPMFGRFNSVAPLRKRRIAGAAAQGYEARDDDPKALQRAIDTWDKVMREKNLRALAQAILNLEDVERERIALHGLAETSPDLPPQLAINWLERLEDYRGIAEQMDGLLGDFASWDRHRSGERTLDAERLGRFYRSSLFRMACFEYLVLAFKRDRKNFWLFLDPGLGELMDQAVWEVRLLPKFSEEGIDWLGVQIDQQSLPNTYSFKRQLADDPEGVQDQWIAFFESCKCRPPQVREESPVHKLRNRAEWIVDTERSHREKVLGWYELGEPPTGPAVDRLTTVRKMRPAPSHEDSDPET